MSLAALHPLRHAALCRIGQQGLEQAAAMLSKLLRQPVGVQVADAWMSDRARLESQSQASGIGIFMAIRGELKGSLLLFFPEASAEWISCRLLRKASVEDLLIEPASSTLKEVGNILASAFLASLENQLDLHSLPSPPEIVRAPIGPLLKRQGGPEPGMIVRTRLFSEATESGLLQGTIYLFPQPASLQLLHEKIGVD